MIKTILSFIIISKDLLTFLLVLKDDLVFHYHLQGPFGSVENLPRDLVTVNEWNIMFGSSNKRLMSTSNFAALKKLVAAREVFDKLPPDSIDVIINSWYQQVN